MYDPEAVKAKVELYDKKEFGYGSYSFGEKPSGVVKVFCDVCILCY